MRDLLPLTDGWMKTVSLSGSDMMQRLETVRMIDSLAERSDRSPTEVPFRIAQPPTVPKKAPSSQKKGHLQQLLEMP